MKRHWLFDINVDRTAPLPPFLQIARALTADIRRGRLRPGDRLPGSRALAGAARVHRNTVLAAYGELVAEGWLEATQGRGTFVARTIPESRASRPSTGSGSPELVEGRGAHCPAPLPEAERRRLLDAILHETVSVSPTAASS